ncbi:MAG: substrate-binding domain-containing protein, partial [Bradyrhizobium sp.]
MQNSVRVLSTLALAGAVRALAEKYRAASGAQIDADFAPTVRVLERLKEGESADVLILTREGLAGLVSAESVVGESCVDLA